MGNSFSKYLLLGLGLALLISGCTDQSVIFRKALFPGGSSVPTAPDTNAQVFFDNPVTAAGVANGYTQVLGSQGYYMSPSTAQNYDAYLVNVKVTGTQNGFLENADIKVVTDAFTTASPYKPVASTIKRAQADSNGQWNFSSVGDPDHRLGQLMAYYWINHEKEVADSALKNSWHPGGKSVQILSYCYDALDNGSNSPGHAMGLNAFWAGQTSNYTCMSWAGPMETAFDASVYVHEMGHANIDYATNGQIYEGNDHIQCANIFSDVSRCCDTADGCSPAINEGQADVHFQMVFEAGTPGRFMKNSIYGLPGRAAEFNKNTTAQQMYNGTAIDPSTNQPIGRWGQEPHYMGGVWAAAWWTLRQNIGSDATNKIFLAHEELLTGSDTFRTGLNVILTADSTLVKNGVFTTNHRQQILDSFNQHGITLP